MPGVANTRSLSSLIVRLFKLKLASLITQIFIASSQESFEGNQMNILRASGLPDFLGRDFLANRFLNIAFGLRSACDMDRIYTSIILFITIFNKLYLFFGASEPMHELLNPLYYPIMYDSPHFSNSLANFWSKTWHQALRRSFIFGGGKPSMWISKKLGFSRKIQKIFFLFGVYFISGLQHEYLAAAVCQKPHSNAYPSKLSPGSFIYFALQPVGIMIEPFIIPHIPKRIGGGMLWTFLFKSMVLTPFSRQFLYFQRHLQPISQIPLKSLINPFA
ncbi:hypothetical protein BY996DRAFT_6970959 [Phakopsora pachyrhizi]|nr:hypothetical protein BY996DRAFT_6970959 [Phakopsora pachyrhizi]